MNQSKLESPFQILTSTLFNNFAVLGVIKYLF